MPPDFFWDCDVPPGASSRRVEDETIAAAAALRGLRRTLNVIPDQPAQAATDPSLAALVFCSTPVARSQTFEELPRAVIRRRRHDERKCDD